MKTIDIQVQKRSEAELGKTGSKQLRKSDTVPCVVYSNGIATHIKVSDKQLHKVLYTPETYLINMDVEGETFQAIVLKAEFHPVKDRCLHVEFMKVSDDRKVEVSLPVKFVGNAPGVTKGGKLLQKLRKIKVKGFAKDLPANIEVNISGMDLGQTVLIKDVDFKGIEVTSPASAAIASVEIPRSLRSAMRGAAK